MTAPAQPASGSTLTVRSPYDGTIVGEVATSSAADVDRAVAAAAAVLRDRPLPPWQRAEILDRAAVRLTERLEEFARIIAAEAAKPIKTARQEAQRAVGTFRFAAAEARTLAGDVVAARRPAGGGGQARLHPARPVGVVGAISPSTSRSTSSSTRSPRRLLPVVRSC